MDKNDIIKKINYFNIKKVIIWGHKLYTHSHGFIHNAWFRIFKYLNIETNWFDNSDNIENINFDNCLFFTEGNVDQLIPINYTSYYILHNIAQQKYIELIKNKRVIIIQKYENIVLDNNFILFQNLKLHYYQKNNIILSLPWATELNPEEIDININNFNKNNLKKKFVFIGSKWKCNTSKYISNIDILNTCENICKKNNIEYIIKGGKVSCEENKNLISNSLYSPAIQMNWQVLHGYIPCRILKNISYGCIPVTNSSTVYDLLNNKPLLINNFDNLIEETNNYLDSHDDEYFKDIMIDVRNNHTYLNRINAYLDFLVYINKENIINPNIDWGYSSNCCIPKSYETCLCGKIDNS